MFVVMGVDIVNSASSLAFDVISHHLWGPRRKSWGIEMTIITSLMRDVSRHSALADIVGAILAVCKFGNDNVPRLWFVKQWILEG